MITETTYTTRRVWLAPVLLMTLMAVAEFSGDWGRAVFGYDRAAILNGEWWRLLTGNLVHLSPYHLMLNELGLVALVLLCPEPLPIWVWIRRVIFIGLFMTLCLLLFVPRLTSYVGMSGVIHGLFVLGLLPQVLKRDLISLGCLVYLVGKIGFEQFAGAPVSDEAHIGGHVVIESHLYGVVGAMVYTALFRTWRGNEGNPSARTNEKSEAHGSADSDHQDSQ